MKEPLPIKGRQQVESIFGRWPSFHDAEVIWVRLDRWKPDVGPTIEMVIHGWEMTDEVDAGGYYVLRNHVLVHLMFGGVDELKIDGLNHQNVLNELVISAAEGKPYGLVFDVHLDSASGLGGSFSCKAIEVLGVQRCDPEGNPI